MWENILHKNFTRMKIYHFSYRTSTTKLSIKVLLNQVTTYVFLISSFRRVLNVPSS
jgi:hypothetical protein